MNRAKKIVLASFMLGVASLNSFAQSDSLRLIWEDESTPDTTRFKALEYNLAIKEKLISECDIAELEQLWEAQK